MRSYRIGSVFGIPIKVDLTFLVVLPLFAYVIGAQVGNWVGILNDLFGSDLAAGSLTVGPLPWVLGSVAAVGLFVGVVLHELGHSLTAMRYGYSIDSITLWLFGGVAQLTEMPEDWRQEFTIAIAGPIVSIAIGVVAYLAFLVIPSGEFAAVQFVVGYLALMNVALAAFNMLPGFPMDGGRVLRALLVRSRPYAEATRIAAEVGKLFAIALGLFGLFGGGGLFLVAIAFFIYIGASSEAQQTATKAAFEGVTVDEVMTPASEVSTVTIDTTVSELVDRMFLERHTGYPVLENGRVVGMVTLEDAREVREVEREAYTVADVMTRDLETIAPDDDAMAALTRMQQGGVGRLIVREGADSDGFAGLVTRSDLMTALDIIRSSGSLEVGRSQGPFGGVRRRKDRS